MTNPHPLPDQSIAVLPRFPEQKRTALRAGIGVNEGLFWGASPHSGKQEPSSAACFPEKGCGISMGYAARVCRECNSDFIYIRENTFIFEKSEGFSPYVTCDLHTLHTLAPHSFFDLSLFSTGWLVFEKSG